MKVTLYIILYFILSFNAFAIEIDKNSSNLDILSSSYIFIDEKSSLSYEDILHKKFTINKNETLGLGISANKTLWIRFTLKNTTDKLLHKVLEYDNPETEDLYFYDGEKVTIDGMFHHSNSRESINPIFNILLNPYEEKVFYISAHCKISTLIAKLSLWNKNDFIQHDFKHKSYLFVFFTIIFTLLIYNFMLYIFTKDRAYIYYVLYLVAVIIFQSIYLGLAQLYFLSNELSIIVTKATMIYISLLLIPIILFSREFLNIYKFKNLDKIFKIYLYIIPLVCIASYDNFIFDLNIILIYVPLALVIVYAGFHALLHGEEQALYYIFGWSVVAISLLFSVLESLGLLNIIRYFSYINEFAFALEALLFSIALAHRIKILTYQKNETDKKVLKELVDEKTKDLILVLNEKDILYRELNHRVKNNIQMILSLIKLQISKSFSSEVKTELSKTKNRIDSMSHLYQALHLKEDNKIDTLEHLRYITHNVEQYFNKNKNIDILYNINYNLKANHLDYCGLIINELITNSFKYAFKNRGIIKIKLFKREDIIHLIVQDDGIGFKNKNKNSLGLSIVKTLVQKQLYGKITIDSNAGTKISITWRDDE